MCGSRISSKGHHYRNTKLHRRIKVERGYRCQICGIVPGDYGKRWHGDVFILRYRDFWVHHIDENPHNDDVNNLAVLCRKCHDKGGYLRTRTNWFRDGYKDKKRWLSCHG